MIRGRKKYVPPNVLEELNFIKADENLIKDSDAFRQMAGYSKVGREFKKIRDRFIMYDIFGNKQK